MRSVLYHLLPFLLPFIGYLVYVLLTRRAEKRGKIWTEAPWYWLVAGGFALSLASLVAAVFLSSEPPGGTYVPAQLGEDGEVIPGEIRR